MNYCLQPDSRAHVSLLPYLMFCFNIYLLTPLTPLWEIILMKVRPVLLGVCLFSNMYWSTQLGVLMILHHNTFIL